MNLPTRFLTVVVPVAFLAGADWAAADPAPCVVEKSRPAVDLPYKDAAALCKTDFGKPWTDGIPAPGPGWAEKENAYGEKVQRFLDSLDYRKPVAGGGLGWLADARWRLTGDWAGCPSEPDNQWTNQVHPAVRIYYSPEVMEWLCANRLPGRVVENPPPMPDGAMIVKEMHPPEKLAYRPGTESETALGKLWVDDNYDDAGDLSWTVMIKGQQSFDGWYWAFFAMTQKKGCDSPPPVYNPPILTTSALTTAHDENGYPLVVDECGKPRPEQHPPPYGPWYPTFWGFGAVPDIAFPNAEFGNYCINCHGSAQSQSTFSSLGNLLGEELEYDYLKRIPPGPTPTRSQPGHEHAVVRASIEPPTDPGENHPREPFPDFDPVNFGLFKQKFPQFADLSYDDVWKNRLPAQTWDHQVSGAGGPDHFLTSDQCLSCHGASGSGQRLPNMVVVRDDLEQVNLSEWAEWSASPMGLAGRDPVFYAMLESELNRASRESDLEKFIPCIQNTCLHCHGNMGQRQHAMDTAGAGDDLCAGFEPRTDPTNTTGQWSPEQRAASGYGGQPFLREYMGAWHGGADPENAKYGGLGRDGISCATCHHIADQDLGNSGVTFTGNFRVGPPNELYGPFDDVLTMPMKNSLGIAPVKGTAVTQSGMCGTCHAIYLPVFDNNGKYHRSDFEQTTYLEWANSAFNEDNGNVPSYEWRSCQDCHMRDDFVYVDGHGNDRTVSLDKTRIANIQDNTFPAADHEQADLDLEHRDYKRHTLYGLNVFLNAYFQQFPLLLGYRQLDFMNGNVIPPLLTAREEVLLIARQATANVTIANLSKTKTGIGADVTVENLGGHKLPSGVGFRRAFIEFQILDENDQPLWSSGRTSDLGIIQNEKNRDLPSELLQSAPDTQCEENYQRHHETITEPCQVQIYEELSKDSDGVFTTSFLHRFEQVKDNRLLPKGYVVLGEADAQPYYCSPWCAAANPHGEAADDDDYKGTVDGSDTVRYEVSLSRADLRSATTITATLYSQATAPYFLNQRFDDARAGPRSADTERLYFLHGNLNTGATADDGSVYLDDYKLLINQASATID